MLHNQESDFSLNLPSIIGASTRGRHFPELDEKRPAMKAPSFPAGEFVAPASYSEAEKQEFIRQLAQVPAQLREAIAGLSEEQLDSKYRNWTIRQIVHHVADSHINCYVRFKWALTESTPEIKSYDETAWSEVVDARQAPLESSLALLEGLHARWCELLSRLDSDQMQHGYFHPEMDKVVTLQEALPAYVWHSAHHLAQIHWIREQESWSAG